MIKLDQGAMQELQRLRNGPLHVFLRSAYEEAKEQLVSQPDANSVRLLQGEALVLRTLLRGVDPESFSTSGKRH